jgi:hypothetical protein
VEDIVAFASGTPVRVLSPLPGFRYARLISAMPTRRT